MKTILFVCTGNVFRSMSAEYCFNKLIGEKDYLAESAGTVAQELGIDDRIVDELTTLEINCSKHEPRRLTKEILLESDLIVAMSFSHQKSIKEQFGIETPLFNEIAFGKKEGVRDIEEAIHAYYTNNDNHDKVNAYIKKKGDDIYDSMNAFIENMDKFL